LPQQGIKRVKNDFSAEIGSAALKLSPVVGVAAWGPAEWMYALTAAYVVLQAVYLLWKWRREARKRA
jgi:hypothetical protein